MNKLTPEDIQAIRDLRDSGETYKVIGQRFNVNLKTAQKVCKGIIGGPLPDGKVVESKCLKLSDYDIRTIRRLRKRGASTVDLGRRFNVHHNTISDVCLGITGGPLEDDETRVNGGNRRPLHLENHKRFHRGGRHVPAEREIEYVELLKTGMPVAQALERVSASGRIS